MKVLVVDDSLLMLHALVSILSEAGITSIMQATDGEEAVRKVAEEAPDLVFMDWIMPNMSGIEAVLQIRAGGSQVPIIMCTSKSDKERVIEAIKAGANNYVVKPFDPEVIMRKIDETMAKAASN
ncbi:MAG: response regulator [Deltaproteobacteria bacterium]|nr:response regulator [Deltaproteobacteria bacterium]